MHVDFVSTPICSRVYYVGIYEEFGFSYPKPTNLKFRTRELVNQLKHVNFIPWNKFWVAHLKHVIRYYWKWIWWANQKSHVFTYCGGTTFWDGQPTSLFIIHMLYMPMSFQIIQWVWIVRPIDLNIVLWPIILADQPRTILKSLMMVKAIDLKIEPLHCLDLWFVKGTSQKFLTYDSINGMVTIIALFTLLVVVFTV